jgi:O-antigen/teichoic acid export membrane protein
MAFINTIVDYFWVIFGSGFARGVALLNTLIVARMLGPSSYGTFTIFYTVMILTWQLPGAVDAVFVSYAKQANSRLEKNEILKTAIFLKLAYLFLVLIISYPLAYAMARYCFHKNEAVIPILSAFLCGACLMFLMTVASTFQEQGRFALYASTNSLYTVAIFICLVVFYAVHIEFNLQLVVYSYIAVSIVVGSVSIVMLFRRVGNLLALDKSLIIQVFSQGKWLFASVTFARVFMRLDIFFLARYVDLTSLGIYSVAAQLIQVVFLATGGLAGISLPKASEAVRSRDSFRVFFRESILVVTLINAGILLFIFVAPYIVTVMYGNQYALAGDILRILLVGWIFNVFFIPFSFLFLAISDSRTRFLLELCKMFIAIILLGWLVPPYGLTGGAYAVTMTLIITTFLSIAVLKYRLRKAFSEFCFD